jgi:Ca2+-binding RTX toxin-like protein
MATFSGTLSNETFNGTVRAEDEVTLAGSARDARFSLDAQGRWVVTTASGGSDTVIGIDQLRFSDGVVRVTDTSAATLSDATTSDRAERLIGVEGLSDGGYRAAYLWANGGNSWFIHLRTFDAQGLLTSTAAPYGGELIDVDVATLANGTPAYVLTTTTTTVLFGNAPQTVVAAGSATISAPELAALSGGGAVVVYTRSLSGPYEVQARVYGADGQAITTNLVVGASGSGPSAVTAMADGGFAVAWSTSAGQLMLRTYSSTGVAEGTAIEVAASGVLGRAPAVTKLADGSFVVTWHAGTQDIMARKYSADGTPLDDGVVLVHDTAQPMTHSATALADGSYVVAWNSGNSSTSPVMVQKVAADGSLLPPVSIPVINSSTFNVSVTALQDGSFLVAWNSTGSISSSNSEVLSLRFDATGAPMLPMLTGSEDGDRLVTSGTGDRRLEGRGGDDRLVAGSGNDWIDGGSGSDTLEGGAGNDTYVVSENDTIVDTSGNDTALSAASMTLADGVEAGYLMGSAAVDLRGNGAANRLAGNGSSNVLDGAGGADTLAGAGGDDTYLVDGVDDTVVEYGGQGTDRIVASIDVVLGTHVENLTLVGADDVDATGNAAHNVLVGNSGANLIDGKLGDDTLAGGQGNDTYLVTALDTVLEEAGAGTDTVQSEGSWELDDNLENLELTGSLAANATGNDLANRLTGNAQANVLDGRGGNDTMDGGHGADVYVVDSLLDVVSDSGTSGTDLVRATSSHTLGAGVENLTLLGAATLAGRGNDLNNVLRGNSGGNQLAGGSGNDLLYGNAGNDILDASDAAGVDTLAGGLGNDIYLVSGTSAEIRELAGQGTDTVRAATSSGHALGAQLENLELTGGDVFGIGNELNNRLTGTAGANRLNGGGGIDVLSGLGGNDTYIVDNAADVVVESAGAGIDEVIASASWVLAANVENAVLAGSSALSLTGQAMNNRLLGNGGSNTLSGLDGADTLDGGSGGDTLLGGTGDDRLKGGGGSDRLEGGTGIDTADYSTASSAITLNLALTTAQFTGGAGTDVLLDIENAHGSLVASDRLTGSTGANVLRGFGGDDTLVGAGGNDALFGGDGADLIQDGAGNSRIDGGAGIDTLSYAAMATGVRISLDLSDAQDTGTAGIDTVVNVEFLVGSATGSDFLGGDAENNRLQGGGGDDTLAGADGDDTLEGGAGLDVADYRGSVFAVRVDLSVAGAQDTEGAGQDTLVAMEGVVGSDWGNDHLTGDANANVLDGAAGADTLVGGLGADTYVVDSVGDRIQETSTLAGEIELVRSSIAYTLGANLENLTLTGTGAISGTGNGLANAIVGNAGANTLNGAAGNDTLAGGAGVDSLIGGTGQDAFRFDSALASAGLDVIADFSVADDRIELDNAVFTALGVTTGALAATAFHVGTAAADAADRIIYNSSTGIVLYDADGSGAGVAVQIARITGVPVLTAADFVVM